MKLSPLKVNDDWIYVLILLLTGLLIVFACLTLSSAREYSGTQDCIVRTQELVATAREVGTLVTDIDSQSRNYSFEPNPQTLARLHACKKRLPLTLAELDRLMKDRPDHDAQTSKLDTAVSDLLAASAAPAGAPARLKQTGLLENVRSILGEIEASDNRMLAKRLHAQTAAADKVFVIMAAVAALVPIVVAFLLMIWHTTSKRRDKAEAELREQAIHLATMNRNLERLSSDLAEARDRAESASRLKSQFVANTSHEIRTPMNAVIGLLSVVAKTKLSSEQQEIIDRVSGSANDLLKVINDILDFSKIEAGKLDFDPVEFSPADCMERAKQLFVEASKTKNIQLVTEVADGVPKLIVGDPTRLHQILVNLISNAVKFSYEGKVVVSLSATVSGAIAQLNFSVSDGGIGMTDEEMKLLFKPFVQADGSMTRKFGGTGLGLSICKALVQMMDGTIGVESKKGIGSTFKFSFPAPIVHSMATAVTQKTKPISGGLSAPHSVQGLILVAEDHENSQYVARLFLQGLGFRSHIVANGAEAVEAYKKFNFDMILMDCQMPVMDGWAATRAIREIEAKSGDSAHIPIVALTAGAMLSDREACIDAGMDDYMTKPLDERVLAQTLRKWTASDVSPIGDPGPATALAGAFDALGLKNSPVNVELLWNRYAEQAPKILNMFVLKTPTHIAALERAINESDCDEASRLAHFLKGSSSTICSEQLTVMFEELGATCRSEDWESARREFAAIADFCKQIEQTAVIVCPKIAEIALGAHG
jgi:signal transduction histidine kinase/FixJ family two-component response regulator/HPt (histidine-containing phosphotransfer) domain-containing protein